MRVVSVRVVIPFPPIKRTHVEHAVIGQRQEQVDILDVRMRDVVNDRRPSDRRIISTRLSAVHRAKHGSGSPRPDRGRVVRPREGLVLRRHGATVGEAGAGAPRYGVPR